MRQITFLLIFVCYNVGQISCKFEDDTDKEKCDHLAAVAAASASSECNEDALAELLAEIEITSPESLVQLAVDNYETICRKLHEHLEKFHKYLETCKISDTHDLYKSLLEGEVTIHKKLCKTPEFSRRFELYYPCLHELRNDFDGCDGPVDWYEDNDLEQKCKNYKHITDCYYIKPAKVCGIDAAKTVKELMIAVVESIVPIKCNVVFRDPIVKDAMPEKYLCGKASAVQSSIKIITLTLLRLFLT